MTTQRTIKVLGRFLAIVVLAATTGMAPPRPTTPAPITRLLAASPFVLDVPYTFKWRAEQPLVRAGYLVVLQVDPTLVYPRQSAEPVLYVDHTTAQRFNVGYTSGRVVAIVPSALDEDGNHKLDLAKAAIWFGAPALPEGIDQLQIDEQRTIALELGVRPPAARDVRLALAAIKGDTRQLANERELYAAAAELVLRYAPDEQDLAQGWLVQDAP